MYKCKTGTMYAVNNAVEKDGKEVLLRQLSDALVQKTVRRMVLADPAYPLGTEQVVCR